MLSLQNPPKYHETPSHQRPALLEIESSCTISCLLRVVFSFLSHFIFSSQRGGKLPLIYATKGIPLSVISGESPNHLVVNFNGFCSLLTHFTGSSYPFLLSFSIYFFYKFFLLREILALMRVYAWWKTVIMTGDWPKIKRYFVFGCTVFFGSFLWDPWAHFYTVYPAATTFVPSLHICA